MSWRKQLEQELETLKTARDELGLQIHLGQQEAKEAWEQVEKKWQHLEAHTRVVAEASRESLDDVEAAWEGLVDEIREGYRSIKALL